MQLPVPCVDAVHPCRPARKQAIGKAPGGRADVREHPAHYRDRERIQRRLQLESAAPDVARLPTLANLQRMRAGRYFLRGLFHRTSVQQYGARLDQPPRQRAGCRHTALHQIHVGSHSIRLAR